VMVTYLVGTLNELSNG